MPKKNPTAPVVRVLRSRVCVTPIAPTSPADVQQKQCQKQQHHVSSSSSTTDTCSMSIDIADDEFVSEEEYTEKADASDSDAPSCRSNVSTPPASPILKPAPSEPVAKRTRYHTPSSSTSNNSSVNKPSSTTAAAAAAAASFDAPSLVALVRNVGIDSSMEAHLAHGPWTTPRAGIPACTPDSREVRLRNIPSTPRFPITPCFLDIKYDLSLVQAYQASIYLESFEWIDVLLQQTAYSGPWALDWSDVQRWPDAATRLQLPPLVLPARAGGMWFRDLAKPRRAAWREFLIRRGWLLLSLSSTQTIESRIQQLEELLEFVVASTNHRWKHNWKRMAADSFDALGDDGVIAVAWGALLLSLDPLRHADYPYSAHATSIINRHGESSLGWVIDYHADLVQWLQMAQAMKPLRFRYNPFQYAAGNAVWKTLCNQLLDTCTGEKTKEAHHVRLLTHMHESIF
jgi:hypothetical protein